MDVRSRALKKDKIKSIPLLRSVVSHTLSHNDRTPLYVNTKPRIVKFSLEREGCTRNGVQRVLPARLEPITDMLGRLATL